MACFPGTSMKLRKKFDSDKTKMCDNLEPALHLITIQEVRQAFSLTLS